MYSFVRLQIDRGLGMNINEAAQLLCLPRDQVVTAINTGITLGSSDPAKLIALTIGNEYDILEEDLDCFITQLHENEPKRQIPTKIRRTLLVEATHRCAICSGTSSLDFHHIIEYSQINHHDPIHMIVLCANCHRRCTIGEIDQKAVYEYKKAIQKLRSNDQADFPARFSWEELGKLIIEVHKAVNNQNPTNKSKGDFFVIEIEKKNEINKMSASYYEFMRDNHQVYFGRIEKFLREPANEKFTSLYYEIVDELNAKISVDRNEFIGFEKIMIEILDSANTKLNINKLTLNIFLSFTYFKCDVGRKYAPTN
jgi:hypothetical protein